MILRIIIFLIVVALVILFLERSGSRINDDELRTYESQFSEPENNIRKGIIKQYQTIKNIF